MDVSCVGHGRSHFRCYYLFVFLKSGWWGSQDAAQDDFLFFFISERCWTLNVSSDSWEYTNRLQERHTIWETLDADTHTLADTQFTDTHACRCTHMHTHTHTCFDKSKPKPGKFSLPCRVIICHSPPFILSGNINRQKKTHRRRDKRTARPQLLFFCSSFLSKPEGTFFTIATAWWIGASHLRAHECRGRSRSDYNNKNLGHGVSLTGSPLLFPEWCLHKTAWTLQRLYLEKDWSTLQRLVCTDTKGGDAGHSGWHVITGHT